MQKEKEKIVGMKKCKRNKFIRFLWFFSVTNKRGELGGIF